MKQLDHYATCPGWMSGSVADCTCFGLPAWRIRKEPDQQFPWRIWRRTEDLTFEPLLSASSWQAAFSLVQGLMHLREQYVRKQDDRV